MYFYKLMSLLLLFHRNTTTPQAELKIVYGQFVKSVELNMLYQAIYKIGKLNELAVNPVTDTSKYITRGGSRIF